MTTQPIQFESVHGLIVVSASVNGEPIRFVVDTGASHTILTRSTAARLELSATDATGRARGASGTTAAVPVIVHSFTWGPVSLVDIPLMQVAMDQVCGLTDSSIGGIIGSDILSKYRFTVDYPKRLISLE